MAKINELVIRISGSSNEPGYFYDIYDTTDITDIDAQSIDGGFCTTTIGNALDMAYEQAKNIIRAGLDYKEAKEKFINEDDKDFDRESTERHNERLWDEWERQIREDERKNILSIS